MVPQDPSPNTPHTRNIREWAAPTSPLTCESEPPTVDAMTGATEPHGWQARPDATNATQAHGQSQGAPAEHPAAHYRHQRWTTSNEGVAAGP